METYVHEFGQNVVELILCRVLEVIHLANFPRKGYLHYLVIKYQFLSSMKDPRSHTKKDTLREFSKKVNSIKNLR